MLRIYVCGAVVWVLSAAGAVQPVLAQGKSVGCDGGVVVKAGRSGPCTKLARTIAGLLEIAGGGAGSLGDCGHGDGWGTDLFVE